MDLIPSGAQVGLVHVDADQIRLVPGLHAPHLPLLAQGRSAALQHHSQNGLGGHHLGVAVGNAVDNVHHGAENLHLIPQAQSAVGRSVRAKAHRDAHFQKLGRVGHRLAAVAEGAMADFDAAVPDQLLLPVGEDQAVGAQEIAAQNLHFLQVLVGPHALPLQDAVDLAHVLVHVGLKHGVPVLGVLRLQLHQAVGAGI